MANVMETIQNKYKQWHDNIIARGKNRILTGYKEKHYIIPKSLGGNNSKDNLVELTAREHFIVHMLLCKFTIGQAKMKMSYGFHAMCSFKNARRYNKVNSRLVEKIRSNFKFTKEHREKISKAQIGNKRAVGNTNNLGRKFSKETKLRMSKSKKGNKNALGLKHSEEFKEKMRRINTGKKYSLGKRYLNKDGKNLVVNKSEVDKYLNQGYKLGMDKSYITLEYRKHQSEMAKAYYRRSA
jgi:hypothetical protein